MDIKYAFVFFLHVLHENLFKNLEIFNSISFPMFTILLLFINLEIINYTSFPSQQIYPYLYI
jgi:hypothetical protein